MLNVSQKEVDAVAGPILSGKLFRYGDKCECTRFEKRYARFLRVKDVCMTASGTNALTAALVGMKIGPGDEVLVPACTYMATPIAVVAAGAIPVVVDIDETTTICPRTVEKAIGPRTRAINRAPRGFNNGCSENPSGGDSKNARLAAARDRTAALP